MANSLNTQEMASRTDLYVYRPLHAGRQEFRLVKLQPSTELSSAVLCELMETELSEHPPYEAISYVWGDPKATAPIHVENAILHITLNLECALRYLRWPDETRWLWVDAISINQEDTDERNDQVRLMKDIYSSCVVDLIWFGEPQADIEVGVATLNHMKALDLQRITQHGIKTFNNQVAIRDLDHDAYYALSQILIRPQIWRRVWVMQEIALCPKAIMVFGHLTMSWDVLSSILDHTGVPDRFHRPFSHQSFEYDVWDLFAQCQVIEHQRDAVRGLHRGYNSDLLDVLSRFRETECTDPRDKIYGLLGLATNTFGVQPDYHKSICEVYLDVARAYIDRTRNLDIICQSQWPLGGGKARRPDLPSWLVDFSCTESTKILFAQRDIFCAGDKTCQTPTWLGTSGELRLELTLA
jgi:Heterokaryon incompatibility protein (HET)